MGFLGSNDVTKKVQEGFDAVADTDLVREMNPVHVTDRTLNFFGQSVVSYDDLRHAHRVYDEEHHAGISEVLDACDALIADGTIRYESDGIVLPSGVKVASRKSMDAAVLETFTLEEKQYGKEKYIYFDGIKRAHQEVKMDVLNAYIEKHGGFEWNDFHLCTEEELNHGLLTGLPGGYGKEKYTALLYVCPFLYGWNRLNSVDRGTRSALWLRKDLLDRKYTHIKKAEFECSLLLIAK